MGKLELIQYQGRKNYGRGNKIGKEREMTDILVYYRMYE